MSKALSRNYRAEQKWNAACSLQEFSLQKDISLLFTELQKPSLWTDRIKAKVGPSPAAFSYCSYWRDLRGKAGSPCRALLIASSLDPLGNFGAECSAVCAGGRSAHGIPTQRPNAGVPPDHSNFQRVVIKLVKLNVLVNKTFWVCLICSKVFLKIEKKLMFLHNTLEMLFFFCLKWITNNNVN